MQKRNLVHSAAEDHEDGVEELEVFIAVMQPDGEAAGVCVVRRKTFVITCKRVAVLFSPSEQSPNLTEQIRTHQQSVASTSPTNGWPRTARPAMISNTM